MVSANTAAKHVHQHPSASTKGRGPHVVTVAEVKFANITRLGRPVVTVAAVIFVSTTGREKFVLDGLGWKDKNQRTYYSYTTTVWWLNTLRCN